MNTRIFALTELAVEEQSFKLYWFYMGSVLLLCAIEIGWIFNLSASSVKSDYRIAYIFLVISFFEVVFCTLGMRHIDAALNPSGKRKTEEN